MFNRPSAMQLRSVQHVGDVRRQTRPHAHGMAVEDSESWTARWSRWWVALIRCERELDVMPELHAGGGGL